MKLFLAAFLLASMLLPHAAEAARDAQLQFAESSFTAEIGEQFDVVVEVFSNQSSLDTVRAYITFDPSVVVAKDAHLTGVFDRSAPGNYIDNVNGVISWGAFTLDEPLDTSTNLLAITFEAVGKGTSSLAFTDRSRLISAGQEQIDVDRLGVSEIVVSSLDVTSTASTVIHIESSSHPDPERWYPETAVSLSWKPLSQQEEIVSYVYVLDVDPQARLAQVVNAQETSLKVDVVEDGLYTFRVQGTEVDGDLTPIAEYQLRVDATAPNPIELVAQESKILEGESVWFSYATTDEASGVAQYQLAMNDGAFQLQSSPVAIDGLVSGTYFFRVAALDRAGNATYGSKSIRVYPDGTDLERPDGYGSYAEVDAIIPASSDESPSGSFPWWWILLGLTVLGFAPISLKLFSKK